MITPVCLRTFRAVMNEGSVTAAAKAMALSQPAVSQQIARLEEALGVSLFFRIRGQLLPTPSAEQLLAEVEFALQSIDRLEQAAESLRLPSNGTLRLAASADFAQTIVAEVIGRISRTHPGAHFHITSSHPVGATQLVASRQVDVALSRWTVEQNGCDVRMVYSSPIVCFIPPGHRLAALDVVTPRDLRDEALILVCRRQESRARIEQVFRESGVKPMVRAETHSSGAASAMVAYGAGCLLYDRLFARYYFPRDIEWRPFQPELLRECVVVTPRGVEPSGLCRAFIDELGRVMAARDAEAKGANGRSLSAGPHPIAGYAAMADHIANA